MNRLDAHEEVTAEREDFYTSEDRPTYVQPNEPGRSNRLDYWLIFAGLFLTTSAYFLLGGKHERTLGAGETVKETLINTKALNFEGTALAYTLPQRPLVFNSSIFDWLPAPQKAVSKTSGSGGKASAQAGKVLFNADKKMVKAFDINNHSKEAFFLEMGYGKTTFRNDISYVKPEKIAKISLVIANYPQGISKEQHSQNRIDLLLKNFPQLANDSSVQWEVIDQVSGNSPDTAKGLLHGFLIQYQAGT